jgi:hypothetical protein
VQEQVPILNHMLLPTINRAALELERMREPDKKLFEWKGRQEKSEKPTCQQNRACAAFRAIASPGRSRRDSNLERLP